MAGTKLRLTLARAYWPAEIGAVMQPIPQQPPPPLHRRALLVLHDFAGTLAVQLFAVETLTVSAGLAVEDGGLSVGGGGWRRGGSGGSVALLVFNSTGCLFSIPLEINEQLKPIV